MTALLILWKAKAPTPQNVAMPSAPSFAGKPATGHVQKRNETYCGIDSHRFTRAWVSPGTTQESCQSGSPSVHIWYHSSAVGRRERNWGGCCVTSHCTLLSLLVVCLKDPKPFSTETTNHILHVGSAHNMDEVIAQDLGDRRVEALLHPKEGGGWAGTDADCSWSAGCNEPVFFFTLE